MSKNEKTQFFNSFAHKMPKMATINFLLNLRPEKFYRGARMNFLQVPGGLFFMCLWPLWPGLKSGPIWALQLARRVCAGHRDEHFLCIFFHSGPCYSIPMSKPFKLWPLYHPVTILGLLTASTKILIFLVKNGHFC